MKKLDDFFRKEYIDYISRGDIQLSFEENSWSLMKDFVKQKLGIEHRKKVIEFGSMLGFVTSLMSKECDIVGLEPVKLLLEFSRNLIKEHSIANCKFFEYEIGNASFYEEFDAGFCIHGLPHFLSFEEMQELFRDFNRVLKLNGLFFVDFTNRERMISKFIPRIWDKVELKSGETLYILQENSLNLEKSNLFSIWTYIYSNRGVSASYNIDLKLYTLTEIIKIAGDSGFRVVEILGSWSGHPYRVDSHRMIVLIRKERRM